MRTKSKPVPRNSSHQTLEEGVSVSFDAGVGLIPDIPIDLPTYLDSNNGSRCVITNKPTSVSDRVMIPAIDFPDFMDVDDSLCYTDVSREGPVTTIDVAGAPMRLANGITINELDAECEVEAVHDCRFPVSEDVTGKGKGKMDDVPVSSASGYRRVDGCVPRSSLAAQSSGQAGVGSGGSFIADISDAATPGSHTHHTSHSLHVHPPTNLEGEFHVPVPCYSTYTTHPLQPLLGTSAAATSGIRAVPFAHSPPTTAAQCTRNTPRRRQRRPTTSSAANVQNRKGTVYVVAWLAPAFFMITCELLGTTGYVRVFRAM